MLKALQPTAAPNTSVGTVVNARRTLPQTPPRSRAVNQATLAPAARLFPSAPVSRGPLPTPPVRTIGVSQASVAEQSKNLLAKNPTALRIAELMKNPIDLTAALKIFPDTDPSEYDDVIKEMCSGETDLRNTNKNGCNPIHVAATHGNVEFFRLLLTLPEALTRIDINEVNPQANANPLCVCNTKAKF